MSVVGQSLLGTDSVVKTEHGVDWQWMKRREVLDAFAVVAAAVLAVEEDTPVDDCIGQVLVDDVVRSRVMTKSSNQIGRTIGEDDDC
jgi:hypothetical protein